MPKSPLLKRKASIADLEDITKIQCSNGNWNYDPYMQGLANGMILSLNVATDDPREPLFKEAPEVWLADIHIDPNDPAHQPIPMTAATPKILYWGGRPGAKELIPQNSNYRAGIWLTDSIKVAASFGREIYRVEVTGLNNPFIVDAQGEFYAEIPTPPEMVSEGFTFLDTCDSDLIVQFALQRGHDSVIIKNVVEGFSGGGVGLSHQSGTDYVLLKEGQGKIVSSFDYKSTLDAWGMPKDPKFSAASKKAETAYTDEDLEEWLADLHVDPVEGGTVPMTAADKVAGPDYSAWFDPNNHSVTAAAIDATNWEDYLVPTEEGISEEDLKQVVAASGLAYTAFQTNPLVVTLGDQYMLVKDGQEFFVEEDWGQVLEDIEYDIPFMLLNWIHGRFRLDSEFKLDRKILKLEGYYFRLDHTKKEGDLIPDIEQWVRDLDDSDIWDLVGDPDELYNDVIGSSLKDFHEQPSDVYHYTTEENLEEIIASGELETTSGTGLTNRFAAGVFTSVDPEEYADGTYGNVCLEIDLPAFLRDFPGVKLSFEPEIEDVLAKEQVVGSLGLGDSINIEPDHSGGMSYGTIIVGAAIPLKYITVDGHPLEPKKASKKIATTPDHFWLSPEFEVIPCPPGAMPHSEMAYKLCQQRYKDYTGHDHESFLLFKGWARCGVYFGPFAAAMGFSRELLFKLQEIFREETDPIKLDEWIKSPSGLKHRRSREIEMAEFQTLNNPDKLWRAGVRIGSMTAETYSLPLSEAVEEHERLVEVLKSPSHADDLKEVEEQEGELREMKEKQAPSAPRIIKEMTRAEVIAAENKANATGKHENNPHRTVWTESNFVYGRGASSFYLIEVPIKLLNHQHDPEDPDFQEPTEETNARINDYATRADQLPPVLITYSNRRWPSTRGRGLAFVANGNHRVEAARRAGKTTVQAYMPTEDYTFWVENVLAAAEAKTSSVAYKPFADASVEEKVERLATNPYHPDRYYHVTNPAAIQSILTTGLKGAEIWVSKGQPWKEYIEGACLELNLEGMELHPDTRWVEEAQTLVAIEPIPASRITRVFDWISEWDMREDQAAKFLSRRGKDEVKDQVMSKFAKVEWDLSPVEDHERAIKLSYKGKLGPNFEVFIYPRQDKGYDCDVHVVTGYGKRNPGVGGNKPYAPYVDFNGTELATAQALATEIKKCMDQELNSLADAARSKGDKALAYNLTREAANLYQEVLNDVTKMLVKLPNPRTNWGKPKASSQGAQARYEALVAELQAIEAKTGLYLTDTNVDRENVGAGDEQSDEFWNSMCYAAEQAAGMRAENAGQDINTLLGRTIY